MIATVFVERSEPKELPIQVFAIFAVRFLNLCAPAPPREKPRILTADIPLYPSNSSRDLARRLRRLQ